MPSDADLVDMEAVKPIDVDLDDMDEDPPHSDPFQEDALLAQQRAHSQQQQALTRQKKLHTMETTNQN